MVFKPKIKNLAGDDFRRIDSGERRCAD